MKADVSERQTLYEAFSPDNKQSSPGPKILEPGKLSPALQSGRDQLLIRIAKLLHCLYCDLGHLEVEIGAMGRSTVIWPQIPFKRIPIIGTMSIPALRTTSDSMFAICAPSQSESHRHTGRAYHEPGPTVVA